MTILAHYLATDDPPKPEEKPEEPKITAAEARRIAKEVIDEELPIVDDDNDAAKKG